MRLSTGMSRAPLEATGTLQSPELVTGLPPRGLKTTEGHEEGEELPHGGGRDWVRRAETFSRRSRTVRRNPPGGARAGDHWEPGDLPLCSMQIHAQKDREGCQLDLERQVENTSPGGPAAF